METTQDLPQRSYKLLKPKKQQYLVNKTIESEIKREMTMKTMQVIHVTKIGDPSVLQLVTVPRPTFKDNEVLVRLSYSGVN